MSKKYFSEDNTYNRVHLSNHIALSLLFVAIPWGFIFALMHRYMLSLIAIPIVIILIGCWLLNKKGHYTFSNLGLILCTATSVFFYASVLGKESGIQWVYFGLTAVSLVLFEPKQKSSLLFGLFFPLVCFYLLELTHYSLFQKEQLDPSSLYFVFTTITTMTFFLIVGCIYFYYFANQRSTQNLVIAHTHLQASHAELNATHTKLQESNSIVQSLAQQASISAVVRGLAHEIKNPLASIYACCRNLLAENLDSEVKQDIEAIQDQILRLDSLTMTMLKDSGEVRIDDTRFHINNLVAQMVRLVGDEGVMKGIKITSHLSDTLPVIRANVAYVGQALLNLLVNALEHTPSGTIEVKTYLKKEEAGDKVVIEVKDCGTGIDPDRIGSIFEPLTSFGKTQGRVLSVNAGMGLHFVKRIMEAHEGEVRVRSVLGEGTVFFLVFPAIKTA